MNPRDLTAAQWNRMVSKTGLKMEDWGEAWLKLVDMVTPTEEDALMVLRHVAQASELARLYRHRLGERTLV